MYVFAQVLTEFMLDVIVEYTGKRLDVAFVGYVWEVSGDRCVVFSIVPGNVTRWFRC